MPTVHASSAGLRSEPHLWGEGAGAGASEGEGEDEGEGEGAGQGQGSGWAARRTSVRYCQRH